MKEDRLGVEIQRAETGIEKQRISETERNRAIEKKRG